MMYIHYGNSKFEDCLFTPVKNCFWIKPIGGLWASKVSCNFSWKDFCIKNNYSIDKLQESFTFQLKPSAKILQINIVSDIKEKIPKQYYKKFVMLFGLQLDFEGLSKLYDAIEVNISNDKDLYWELYGWDCDSILIMNKEVLLLNE